MYTPTSARIAPTVDRVAVIRALAFAAILLLSGMVVITFATGVSQEPFEVVRPLGEYRLMLLRGTRALSLVLGLDSLFIPVYAAFFVLFARLHRDDGATELLRLGTAALLAAAVLDVVEDQHFFALMRGLAEGDTLSLGALRAQHVLSQSKFHLSYVGIFFFGLGLPRRSTFERVFSLSLALPLPLLGAWIWIAPPSLELPLNVARWLAFLAGFGGAILSLANAKGPGREITGIATATEFERGARG